MGKNWLILRHHHQMVKLYWCSMAIEHLIDKASVWECFCKCSEKPGALKCKGSLRAKSKNLFNLWEKYIFLFKKI